MIIAQTLNPKVKEVKLLLLLLLLKQSLEMLEIVDAPAPTSVACLHLFNQLASIPISLAILFVLRAMQLKFQSENIVFVCSIMLMLNLV